MLAECESYLIKIPTWLQPCMGSHFFFFFENANRATTMAGLSLGGSKASTVPGFFYASAGHQPCLDFFSFFFLLCANRTSTVFELFRMLVGQRPYPDFRIPVGQQPHLDF